MRLWWNNVCPSHGAMDKGGYRWYCRHCQKAAREEYTDYQDTLRTRWKISLLKSDKKGRAYEKF